MMPQLNEINIVAFGAILVLNAGIGQGATLDACTSAGTGIPAEVKIEKFMTPEKNTDSFSASSTKEAELTFIKENLIPSHPWAHLAGKYDDEPAWNDFIEAIEDYRRSIDEQEDTAE